MRRFLLRLPLAAFLVWCVVVETAEAFASRLFAVQFDGDWFLIFAASDPGEIGRFFSMYAAPLGVALAAIAGLSAAAVYLTFRLRGRAFTVFALAAAAFAGLRIAACGKGWKPLYVAWDTAVRAADYRALVEAGAWTPERAAAVEPAPPGATNLVIVIGESLTSDRMGLYGYAGRTTPELASLGGRLAVLGPVTTTEPYTARSLTKMLSRRGGTLPVALRLGGYRTALVSAQNHWERYCGIEQMVFAACEKKTYLGDDAKGAAHFDGDLVALALAEMADGGDGRPFAVFLHMMGSHFPPGDRVPEGFAAGEGLDDYDRSVRYTDCVLARLIRALPPRTALVFTSDHGESVDRPGWRDLRSKSLWRVPLLVYPAEAAGSFKGVTDVGEIWYNGSDVKKP
ncbi:MAG: sulfatase-like hydrolase/transferase [Kiritimatiellae bacterium]|nr:sulfatase-like hydrolase/transferase [Kiritimatiellia bacterium]